MSEITHLESPSNEINWNNIQFDGKEFCILKEDNHIYLKGSEHFAERMLIPLNVLTESTIKALGEKFQEVKQKVDEVHLEWQTQEDKLKLSGKVFRLKDYLNNVAAIGNFGELMHQILEKETVIKNQFEQNLLVRKVIAEKAEALKDSQDWKETTEAFRNIIEEWKTAPMIEKNKSDHLWDKIEHARQAFFDNKRNFQEELGKDFMQNLDLKLEICEIAEKLSTSTDWRKTTDEMKSLFEQWKGIGRVSSHEKNEELWNRFNEARNIFFENKKQHFNEIIQEHEKNYLEKISLVEQAENISNEQNWKEGTDKHAQIMEAWKNIGKVPLEKADEIWKRLQQARDTFFEAKRDNSAAFKVNLEDNYAQKLAITNRAEQIKDSREWREVTNELNELMAEWKNIGPVPREHSEIIWQKFIQARRHFFNRKDADREKKKEFSKRQSASRLKQTIDFLQKLEEDAKEDEERLVEFKKSLENTSGFGRKEEELKQHLNNLIQEIEQRKPSRLQKIEEVKKQLSELEENQKEDKEE